ncbi:MAG: sucrase ferredoxin [Nocardioidaceae bacterium]
MSRCSDESIVAEEQLAGTSPHASAWVCLEQTGPWGAKAFTASHLDPDLGRAIEAAAADHGVRPALVRRPGPHPDARPAGATRDPRRVLVACTRPGRSWVLAGQLPGPVDLLALDWAALARGDADAVRRSLPALRPEHEAHLLVCTNGRRDVCCAVKGRPLALALADRHPGTVWETTHTSGHRFAPTAVLLPAGTLHGRLDVAGAEVLLHAAARRQTVLAGSRGRSTWTAPGQVAELAVREWTGELGLDALTVTAVDDLPDRWRVRVGHADGRAWWLEVWAEDTGIVRRESCAKAAVALRRWHTSVEDLGAGVTLPG